ncbi:MAG: major capsid protein [Tistlia sp.]|uniref:major capsid protein n=1 Tax=Tistlia sp. TaxID=3057121 RepID=UPI0034A21118
MVSMDVFKGDAFSATSLTASVDKVGYVPTLLDSMPGLFMDKPIRTTDVWIEERDNGPALIQTSERGSPIAEKEGDKRKARSFRTVRLAQKSRIMSEELQNIRAFGQETELKQLQTEIARRQVLMRNDMQLTREHHALGCLQGLVTDADGSTLYNWATEFGQTIPVEVDFDLDAPTPASGVVRKKCNAAVRSILRGLKGLGGNQVEVIGLAGDNFWDDLTAHSEVRETYLQTQAAASLREGNAFESFRYGGITWINYRGTDDGSTVAVGTDKAKFFPRNAGIFQRAWAPAERFEFVNTPGKQLYSWIVLDRDDNAWADVKQFAYPLYVCVQPQALYRAKRT